MKNDFILVRMLFIPQKRSETVAQTKNYTSFGLDSKSIFQKKLQSNKFLIFPY